MSSELPNDRRIDNPVYTNEEGLQQVGAVEVEESGDLAPTTDRERSLRVRLMPYLDSYGIIILVVVMVVVLQMLRPDVFLTWTNVTNIFRQIAVNAILALGQFVVIVTAGIDLSVGATMALAMVVLAQAIKAGIPWYVAIWLPLLVGMGVGVLNGLGLTKLRLPHPLSLIHI